MKTLSTEQRAVVESDANTIVAIASPGSGKTFTLIQRVRRLLHDGEEAGRIAILTYTNAAARELEKRLQEMWDDRDLYDTQVTDELEWIKASELRLGFVGTLHSFLFRLLTRHGGLIGLNPPFVVIDEDQRKEILAMALDELAWRGTVKAVETEVAKGCNPFRVGKTLSKEEIAATAFYQKLKDESVLTFDMVLQYGLKIAEKIPSLPFDFLFVDEFQDSSDIDAAIYNRLPIGKRFFVGDPDQSIYSFRGGNVDNIVKLATAGNQASVFLIEGNYRSGQIICEAAQRLICHSKTRVEKVTRSLVEEKGLIWSTEFPTGEREAFGVANDLIFKFETIKPADCAVLVRTNRLVAETAKTLKGMGVPVRERKKIERPDDWALARTKLALLNNPDNDRLAYLVILNSAGKEKADEVRRSARNQFKTINEISLRFPYNLPLDEALTQLARMNVSRLSLEFFVRFKETLPAEAGIPELILALSREELQQEETGEGVTVTTIHAAKGREWRAVWLPALEQQVIPSLRKDVNVEEERRLCYVAVTRAKEYLWLSWAKLRTQEWGPPKESVASQFLGEMMPVY